MQVQILLRPRSLGLSAATAPSSLIEKPFQKSVKIFLTVLCTKDNNGRILSVLNIEIDQDGHICIAFKVS